MDSIPPTTPKPPAGHPNALGLVGLGVRALENLLEEAHVPGLPRLEAGHIAVEDLVLLVTLAGTPLLLRLDLSPLVLDLLGGLDQGPVESSPLPDLRLLLFLFLLWPLLVPVPLVVVFLVVVVPTELRLRDVPLLSSLVSFWHVNLSVRWQGVLLLLSLFLPCKVSWIAH